MTIDKGITTYNIPITEKAKFVTGLSLFLNNSKATKVTSNGNIKSAGHIDSNGKRTGLWKHYMDNSSNDIAITIDFETMISKEYYDGYVNQTGKLNNKLYKVGVWKSYHKNGMLESIGEHNGRGVYGTEKGEWKHYYDNGNLDQIGYYTETSGNRKGKWTDAGIE